MRLLKFFGPLKRLKPPIVLRRVVGTSMVPTLIPGQIVIAYRTRHLREGDVVLVRHQGLDKIKRIKHLTDSSVYIVGDNPTGSTDSRSFGNIPRDTVQAKVVIRR